MTSKPISCEQVAAEDHIHQLIEAHDVNVLLDYATFAEQELASDPVRNLLLGILMTNTRVWRFALAEMGTHNRSVSAALLDLSDHLERQRAAFMEHQAIAMLKEAQGEQA